MKKAPLLAVTILMTALSSYAQLTGISPNTGTFNQTLMTTITGNGIFIQAQSPGGNLYEVKLTQGANTIMMFDFWNSWNYNCQVTSINTVDVDVIIPMSATPGVYDLNVTTGDILNPWMNQVLYTLPGAFTIAPPDGYIQGNVYHDLNKNGIKDGGEPGLQNRQIKLIPGNIVIPTDLNGDYSFPVANGNYSVIIMNDINQYLFVTSLNDTLAVTVSSGNSTGNDFGLTEALNSITPDAGLPGSTTIHTIVSDEPIFQTGGNPYGNVTNMIVYSSPGITVPVNTSVIVIDPYTIQASIAVPSNAIIADSIDIRIYVTGTYTGYHFLRKKFRIDPPDGYVMGQVYDDQNRNGVKDAGEPGISNYVVQLLPANVTGITDAGGNYSIPASNGNYSLITVPSSANYLFVSSMDTIPVTVNSGNSTGNDFGMKPALVSITPNIGYQGTAVLHQFVADEPIFIPGGNPYGNVSQIKVYASPNFFVNVNGNVTVIDSVTIQVNIQVPFGTLVGNNIDISVYTSPGFVGFHYLRQQFSIQPTPAIVTGRLFFDQNQDKINDPSEPGIYAGKVKLTPDNSIAFADFDGNFYLGSTGGVQTLTYENNVSGLVLFTDSTSYTFNASGTTTGKDFGFQLQDPDYAIQVSQPYTIRRCNTNQITSFQVANKGNIPFDATVWLYHSPNMLYVSALPTPTLISNDTIYWSVSNIQPYQHANILAAFTLPGAGSLIQLESGASSLDAGGVVQYSDSYPATGIITCSWDPNDKQVTPPGIFAQNYTLMSDTLEYLINFQNTGNDTSINVVVLDTLNSNFDLNSFQVLSSSHSVQTEVESNGAVRFAFNNIMLPDSNINEPESHGYVRYRINANPGLVDTTEVINTAHIFFDFNSDVVTNTTLNTLVYVLPVGIGEVSSPDAKVLFYPNPFSNSATLLFENPASDIYTLTLTAITGNKIAENKSTNGNNFVIEKGKLPKGIYFYNLTNTVTNKMYSGKFIVE